MHKKIKVTVWNMFNAPSTFTFQVRRSPLVVRKKFLRSSGSMHEFFCSHAITLCLSAGG